MEAQTLRRDDGGPIWPYSGDVQGPQLPRFGAWPRYLFAA